MDEDDLHRCLDYIHYSTWWVRTSESWLYQDLLLWFLSVCWDEHAAAYATGLLHRHVTQSIRFEERAWVVHQQQPTPQAATQD